MAGNEQKKGQNNAQRMVPRVETSRSSRTSKAASAGPSNRVQMEQRSSAGGSSRSRAGGQGTSRAGGQGTSRAGGQGSGRGGSQVSVRSPRQTPIKGGSAGTPARKKAAPVSQPPADSRLIGKMRDQWSDLQPHEQQRFMGIFLLVLSVLFFLILTIWSGLPVFNALATLFFNIFAWAAIPLALGAIAFACAHFIEGMRNTRFIRWQLILGLLVMLILLLMESQLLMGHITGGILGSALTAPIQSWGFAAHVIVLGVFVLVALLTFQITLSHIMLMLKFIQKVFIDPRDPDAFTADDEERAPSAFLGQRPRFSRYSQADEATERLPAPSRKVAHRPLEDDDEGFEDEQDEQDEEQSVIDFEDDFDAEDDPRNDINLHKQEVSRVPRGPRPPQPVNREELHAAVKGARQQKLPVPETPSKRAVERVVELEEIEPLAPNPLLGKLQIKRRSAKSDISSPWQQPDTSLFNSPEDSKLQMLGDDTSTLAKTIQDTLRSFRVEAEVRPEDISIGPTVIRFGIRPTGKPMMKEDERGRLVPVRDSAGNIIYETRTRVSRIMALQNDLALVLESKTIRMEAPVPGRPYVGVEIPNKNSRLVTLREILESKEFQTARAKSKLTVALGKDVAGVVRVGDLAKMPHLLIAGATGAGKSVMINAIISSIITQATPDDVRMLMVDPKMVELNMYNGIPHLLSPVVIDVDKVVGLLKVAIGEMEKRYRLFSQLGVRNLDGYRKLRTNRMAAGDQTLSNLPAIVIIIDELADLMMAAPEEVEGLICRLAQLARATGIHLVVATQRPSVDVITGLIKANIPTRISFMVSSAVDSRTIIDMGGAERLLGRGDMLYLPADAGKPERIQGAFVADEEAERLVSYWRQQAAEHEKSNQQASAAVEPGWEVSESSKDEFELEDELLEQAEEVIQEYGRASISLLQRRLKIGYSRAARLIDLLEENGTISRAENGGRKREVLGSRHGGEGHTMAAEADEIMEEEKRRQEFLRQQAERDSLKRNHPRVEEEE